MNTCFVCYSISLLHSLSIPFLSPPRSLISSLIQSLSLSSDRLLIILLCEPMRVWKPLCKCVCVCVCLGGSTDDVPVQHKLPKPNPNGQGARRRYQLCLPLAVWVLEVPQLPLVDNWDTASVQYKTRYPFYRWVGWNIMVLFDGKYSCIGIRTQLTRLLGKLKHASVEPPRHTHTHTHTLTQWLSHSHRFA